MGDIGYPLDLWTPVRHVATEMDRVSPDALSIEEMAATYMHPNTGDISRVMSQEGCANQREANEWLMGKAVEAIMRRGKAGEVQVEANGHGYRLAVPFKTLKYEGKAIYRTRDDHAQFGDPFNGNAGGRPDGRPESQGTFSDNLRRKNSRHSDMDDELRDSMRSFGWIEQLPAIKDERGVVLVGHRRLAVAKELGIEPVWWHEHGRPYVTLGDGDEGDSKRFGLALASNFGSKPFTPEERKDFAEYLYGERKWTMQRIADALKVSVGTVSHDLEGFSATEKPARSKGGRPKGSTTRRKAPPELDAEALNLVEAGKPVPREELAAEFGVGKHAVNLAHQRAIGAIEERQRRETGQCKCPNCGDVHNISD